MFVQRCAARVLRGKRQHGNCRTFRHALSLYTLARSLLARSFCSNSVNLCNLKNIEITHLTVLNHSLRKIVCILFFFTKWRAREKEGDRFFKTRLLADNTELNRIQSNYKTEIKPSEFLHDHVNVRHAPFKNTIFSRQYKLHCAAPFHRIPSISILKQ